MAEVFKAKSYGVEGFEKVVVIKRILPELAESQNFVEMFIHEAKLAVRLSHANIVQVFDLGIAPAAPVPKPGSSVPPSEKPRDAYYMAMEYVHGFDLSTLLTRMRRASESLPLPMCAFLVAEVAKGLDYAHRRRDEQARPLNIVHRDVSPQNVLLSLEGEVKVTDFGIAKARGVFDDNLEDTKSRKLLGKYAYMSPEQARGDRVGAATDIFSLGVVLYECITGVSPFAAPSTFETMRRVQECEYPPLELLRPDVPQDLMQIVKTALAKEPGARFPDAGRMHESLLAFIYGHGFRYSSHDLAQALSRFRSRDQGPDIELADGEVEVRTPAPISELSATVSDRPAEPLPDAPAQLEVTALALLLPSREQGTLEAAEAMLARYGAKIAVREAAQVVALFGLTDPDGHDTETAIRCALAAGRKLSGDARPSVGVHCARVHVQRDGEVMEDEQLRALVDRARELARHSDGVCHVSLAALRAVRSLFDVEEIPNMRESAIVRAARPLASAFGRFVGRRDELRKVGEVLALATKRSARVLTIRGENGVGKTRLLVEVERRIRKGNYAVGFYMAACPPRGREIPYSGIVCMLHVLCGIAEGEVPRTAEVQPRLRALGLQDDEVAATLGLLGGSLTAPVGDLSRVLRDALARIVSSLCEDQPHVFAWDAAHWMDEESGAVLEAAFARQPNVRAVFAFVGRPGFSHPLERLGSHVSLSLSDLSKEDAERLIAVRLGVDRVPKEVLSFVLERAGGHPLFIEEVLKGLLQARAITVAEGAVVSMQLVGQDLALPKTLRGLVSSRVLQLEADDRAVLEAASVLGDLQSLELLARVRDKSLPEIERSLLRLSEREFFVASGATEWRFRSPIVRDIVLDSLPAPHARELHRASGDALVALFGENVDLAGQIAAHLYEAGDLRRAAQYFARSAERRLAIRQLDAAARDFARALSLADGTDQDVRDLGRWLHGLASAARASRVSSDATVLCERVISRADALPDLAFRVGVRVDAGHVLAAANQFDLARAQFTTAEQIASGDPRALGSVLAAAAQLAARKGDYRRAESIFERLAKEGDGTELTSGPLLLDRARTAAALGQKALALSLLHQSEGSMKDDLLRCERQKVSAIIEYLSGDFRAAAAAAEVGLEQSRSLGLTRIVAEILQLLGELFIRQNDLPRAYGALQQATAISEEVGDERLSVQSRSFSAFLDAVAGDREADARIREGIEFARDNDYTSDRIAGHWLMALLFARRGAPEASRSELEKLSVLAKEAGIRLVQDDCARALKQP